MKKLFLVCLMMLAGSAWAEWVLTLRNGDSIIYIDPETIRKDGNLRRVWTLIDYAQKSTNGRASTRLRVEYDCKEERHRVLSLSTHSEAMAGGDQLVSHTYAEPIKWDDIPPQTGFVTILKIVCAK